MGFPAGSESLYGMLWINIGISLDEKVKRVKKNMFSKNGTNSMTIWFFLLSLFYGFFF